MNFSKFLKEYFVKYASVNTQSDSSKKSLPSSEGQKKLLDIIKADLESFGLLFCFVTFVSVTLFCFPGMELDVREKLRLQPTTACAV